MAASPISGSSNNVAQILSSLQGGSQSQQAGGLDNLGVELKELMDLIKQLEGGVSKKAAPTHVAW